MGRVALRLGRADDVISTVCELVAEYPLSESLECLFMRTLHAAGRDAEAVERYAVVRRRLADELGIDPGTELRSLHSAFLRGELPDPGGGSGDPVSAPPTPQQLPAYASRFVGRAEELGQLTKLLDEFTRRDRRMVVITVIDGTAGVGKTALALNVWGLVHIRQCHWPEASEHLRQALAISRDIGDRASEPHILNHLGNTCHASGDDEQALTHHAAALALATELGDSYERAHAEQGLTRDDSRRVPGTGRPV